MPDPTVNSPTTTYVGEEAGAQGARINMNTCWQGGACGQEHTLKRWWKIVNSASDSEVVSNRKRN